MFCVLGNPRLISLILLCLFQNIPHFTGQNNYHTQLTHSRPLKTIRITFHIITVETSFISVSTHLDFWLKIFLIKITLILVAHALEELMNANLCIWCHALFTITGIMKTLSNWLHAYKASLTLILLWSNAFESCLIRSQTGEFFKSHFVYEILYC